MLIIQAHLIAYSTSIFNFILIYQLQNSGKMFLLNKKEAWIIGAISLDASLTAATTETTS